MGKLSILVSISLSLLLQGCDCMQHVVGDVIDNETQEQLSGVKVYKVGNEHDNSITDEKGGFEVKSISGGLFRCPPMKIVLEKDGYETIQHKGGGQVKLKKKLDTNNLIIEKENVDRIEIRILSEASDSVQIIKYTLNEAMTNELIDRFNSSKSVGPCKYIVLYWLDFYATDGSKRTFRVNGQSVKEKNDWCYNIKDSDCIGNIWKELQKE